MQSVFNCFRRVCRPTDARTARKFGASTLLSSASTSAIMYAATISASSVAGAVPEESKAKKHHLQNGKGFDNPWDSWENRAGPELLKMILTRRWKGEANIPDTTPPTVVVRKPEFLPTRKTPSLRATWLGHACYLVEFPSGLRVLFDPVFSCRCSPSQWFGPKRYTPAPCDIDQLPIVDVVVISHNHYDHLDLPTIKKIAAKHRNVHFFAPLGNKKWFVENGFAKENVTELDWWEERNVKLTPTGKSVTAAGASTPSDQTISATISCLPCQHTSARTPFDKGQTLWASWSVTSSPTTTTASSSKTSASSVYFAGDTGYRIVPAGLPTLEDHLPLTQPLHPHCPVFASIGELRGPFDLGLIPIGAYEPRYIMSSMHSDPFDAVEIMRDTRCRRALGMHWGTWVLTEEDVLEPPRLLQEALRRRGMKGEGCFDVCEIGESTVFETVGRETEVVYEKAKVDGAVEA